ncbi:MAG: NUDIX domain-containing protein [Micrococcales bacterium]|nr:NUDIX domain-containing protein [Micrococcales bacterium]
MAQDVEMWDVLGMDGLPTGRTVVRATEGDPVANLRPGEFYRDVYICLFSTSGDVLIQQRAAGKYIDPGLWDLSAGGAVLAGETSQKAASRELAEELGISIDFTGHRPVITATHPDAYFDIYLADLPDGDLSGLVLQPEEVQSARWAGLNEILAMIADGTFCGLHPSLVELVFAAHKHPSAVVWR